MGVPFFGCSRCRLCAAAAWSPPAASGAARLPASLRACLGRGRVSPAAPSAVGRLVRRTWAVARRLPQVSCGFSCRLFGGLRLDALSCGGVLRYCGLSCFPDRLPNFPHSPARCGRERHRLAPGPVADRGQTASSSVCVSLSIFRGDHQVWPVVVFQPLLQFQISSPSSRGGHPSTTHKRQRFPLQQVTLDQLLPLRLNLSWEPVRIHSREDRQNRIVADPIEIDQLRATRPRLVNANPLLPPGVQQAGFPDVTSPQEGNFGKYPAQTETAPAWLHLLRIPQTAFEPGSDVRNPVRPIGLSHSPATDG